jgi:hypothetical protein
MCVYDWIKGKINLQVGNRARVIILIILSGMILELNNYYFIQVFSRNIISIFYLALNGFKIIVEDKCCFFFNSNVYYRSTIYRNHLYILDLKIFMLNIKSKRNRLGN